MDGDIDVVRRAFLFALRYHGTQKYGYDPYMVHLFDVYNVLIEFGHDDNDLLVVALLHDIIEDTLANYADVLVAFGERVAEAVYACTDSLGRNRKERKKETLARLIDFSRKTPDALTVKLADWIANVRDAHRHTPNKLQMYRKEWPDFYALSDGFNYPELQPMWNCLNEMLTNPAST